MSFRGQLTPQRVRRQALASTHMRGTLLAVSVLLAVTACSSDDTTSDGKIDTKEEVEEATGVNAEEWAEIGADLEHCQAVIASGDPLTQDDIDRCGDAYIVGNRDCDDGSKVYAVEIDDQAWALRVGEPATEVDDVFTGARCD